MSKRRTEDLEWIAAALKALSNPQRLRIFLDLAAGSAPGCCAAKPVSVRRCAGDLGADLGVGASTVSHHLKELRQAGLMHMERRGRNIECWISDEALHRIAAFIGALHRPEAPARKERRTECRTRKRAVAERA